MIIDNLPDTPGTTLGFHAQKLTELIARALTNAHKQLILDPDSINNAQRKYDVEISKALSEWNKQWKDWADKDLATAYLQGVKRADNEIKQRNLKTPPDKPISSSTPMAGKADSLLPDKAIPRAIQKTFKTSNIPNHLTFYNVFRRVAYHNLEGSSLQVLRSSRDLFRDAAIKAGEKMFKETDIFTRRAYSQEMLDDLIKQGIKSVTYKNGRKVSIEAYAEMVGRTTSHHAAIQAELNRYEEYGYDLVRVSSHFRACPLCVPWEGAILKTNEINDPHQEEYDGYLSDAISAGLFHPNCAHGLTAYFPELSPDQEVRMDPAEQELVNQHGYKKAQELAYQAQEQQRYIERQIRNWKMRGITALDDAETKKAYNKVLHWQTAMRTHIKDNSFLRRHYEVGKGYIREHVAGWDAFHANVNRK